MKEKYVLLDFENVQPSFEQLDGLAPGFTDVWLFHNRQQLRLATKLKAEHARVTLVQISRPGNNALDFHLSFYLGYLAAKHPEAELVVVANDTGYDPMVLHANHLGFRAARLGFKAGKAAAGKPAPAKKPSVAKKPAPAKKPASVEKMAPAKKPALAKKVAPVRKPTPAKNVVPVKRPAAAKKTVPVKTSGPTPPAALVTRAAPAKKVAPASARRARTGAALSKAGAAPTVSQRRRAGAADQPKPAKASSAPNAADAKKLPLKKAPAPTTKARAGQTAVGAGAGTDMLDRVTQGLVRMGHRRPVKLKSLLRLVESMLGEASSVPDAQALVEQLGRARVLEVAGERVTYL